MEMLTQPELKQGEWHGMVLCTKTAPPQLAPISVHAAMTKGKPGA